MELLKILLISLLLQLTNGDVKKSQQQQQQSNDDLNRACIIRFLQIKGKMDVNIQSSSAPADLCRILLPLVYANHSERLCLRLWDMKIVKAECVFETLKKFEYVDLELKYEVYSKLKNLPKNDKRMRLYDIINKQRDALMKTAKLCKSDFTYGGLFDEILGINSSLIALQKEYCLLKYAIDNRFLDVRTINLNPRNIDTVNIQCVSIIVQCQDETKERLMEAFKHRRYSSDAITCLLEKYKDERIFGWNLAKDLLHKLKINENVKHAEDWRISKVLSDFNKISSNCLFSFNWSLF